MFTLFVTFDRFLDYLDMRQRKRNRIFVAAFERSFSFVLCPANINIYIKILKHVERGLVLVLRSIDVHFLPTYQPKKSTI